MFLVPLVCYSVLHRPDQDVVAELPVDGFQFLFAEPKGNSLFSIPTVCEEHVCATTGMVIWSSKLYFSIISL